MSYLPDKYQKVISRALQRLKPPPKLTVSEWADEYRYLSPESSAEPGKWRTDRAEYQRGIMDAFSDPRVHTIVVMSSAQVGKTSIIENIIGYFIHQDPSPILVLQPTLEMAQTFSKDRLAKMLRDTPVLRDKVKDPRSRDSGNTTLHKQFPGGHVTIVGANSPAGLASRPIRVVLADEVDRYPESAGTEGDPVTLAFKRTATFWNRKHAMMSTPTIKGASRIELAFEQSDKRFFLVPCPHCGEFQRLKWAQVKWTDNNPNTARYCCEHCGALWDDVERHRAVRKGRWEATAPFNGIAGFHLSELYSPWRKLSETVRDFLAAKDDYEMLKSWVNTALGETFEVQGEGADSHELIARLEDYKGVPDGVHILTAGVDVQDDRIEIEVVGWGASDESWSIAYHRVYGSPDDPATWDEVAHLLSADYDGHRIMAACIDSGGHFTQQVYRFCKDHQDRRWWPVKGANTTTAPPIGRPSMNNRLRVPLFTIGVSAIKETIYFRLKREEPGPGYMHFSKHVNDEEYFRQLTAEQLITKWRRGVPERRWVKTRERNEALDCRVYAYAALLIANPRAVSPRVEKAQPQKRQRDRKPSGSWAYGWRQRA